MLYIFPQQEGLGAFNFSLIIIIIITIKIIIIIIIIIIIFIEGVQLAKAVFSGALIV